MGRAPRAKKGQGSQPPPGEPVLLSKQGFPPHADAESFQASQVTNLVQLYSRSQAILGDRIFCLSVKREPYLDSVVDSKNQAFRVGLAYRFQLAPPGVSVNGHSEAIVLVSGFEKYGSKPDEHVVHRAVYHFSAFGNREEYFCEHVLRKTPHAVCQTDEDRLIRLEHLRGEVLLFPHCFWERQMEGWDDHFLVCGHVTSRRTGRPAFHRVLTTWSTRYLWAHHGVGLVHHSIINMIKVNIQHRVNLFLRSRAKEASRGFVPAISIDNVPPAFPYWVFCRKWWRLAATSGRVKYNSSSGLHQICGTCRHFLPLFGKDIEETEGGGLDGQVTFSVEDFSDRSRPFLRVTDHPDRGLAVVTLRWNSAKAGTLLIIFGGLEWHDPLSARGLRGLASWDTKENLEQQDMLATMAPNDGSALD
eukprot:CAMPEP_0181315312 /NCGR_PEP_ID=MMETSP1101-20121128/15308_1 /TAXON_ID=46948 /ORGANISM="Rhodomonas abbreviata, Strain Caron Lab Isolate" /LENGTH=416 /DNA_ID=CAMNT_0023422511 /DNA_START=94 /DNA_END=1344 /DNA_ORIENTATION=+